VNLGFAVGMLALPQLPSWQRIATATVCIVVGTAIVNLAPENPYQPVPD
jgi:hypothetical protein